MREVATRVPNLVVLGRSTQKHVVAADKWWVDNERVDGPTQTAVEGAAKEWAPRPIIAHSTRLVIVLFPYFVGFVAAILIARWWPATRFGIHPLLWWVGVAAISTVLMIPADRLIRRLVPMSNLLALALAFPDAAPSRFKAAMRSTTIAQVRRRVEEAVDHAERGAHIDRSQYMLDLASLITQHDRLTRGHSERVRAYATLIGQEIRLSKTDQQKLYWAAFLHDIGKMDVPSEILNKKSRPTESEWKILQSHPAAAVRYLAPLEGWLGPWAQAADEHHLRWDGNGYPKDIGGTDISLAGRIVAIADAYDVMTCARSYKKGMDPADARVELAACAGGQFDPTLVRAFLNIGLSRVRIVAGPLASAPALISALLGGVATNGGRVLLATAAATSGMAVAQAEPRDPPAIIAFAEAEFQWEAPTPTPEPTAEPAVVVEVTPEPVAIVEPTVVVEVTPEPVAIVEPTVVVEVTPEPAAIVEPTVVVESTPEPTVAVEVTPEPTATGAPVATAAPTPTSAPAPTTSPVPTATAVPTATPLPTATATPAPTPTALPTATPVPIISTTPQQNLASVKDALALVAGQGSADTDERIFKAIVDLESALDPWRWVDPYALDPGDGDKVFNELADAVDELQKVSDAEVNVSEHIAMVTQTAENLALGAMADAAAAGSLDLSDAYEELAKAANEESSADYDKAIEHYKHAWQDAFKAHVPICHLDDGSFEAKQIDFEDLASHRAHGDGQIGDTVPGEPGQVFGPDCVTEAG